MRLLNYFHDNAYAYPLGRSLGDWLLFAGVLVWGALFAWYVYSLDLTLILIDQFSHASIGRQITDSLTPGASQVGFWPPLLHILLIPVSMSDWLFHSGLAAACVLVPLLALSTVALYRLVWMLSGSWVPGIAAAIAYVLNPFVLYYAATPMMEMLFVPIVILAAYFFVHWWHTDRFGSLMWFSVCIALSTIARFEGFILVPIAGLAIVYRLLRVGKRITEIESVVYLFGLIAITGIACMSVYGIVFADNPFEFVNGAWSAQEQQKDFELPAAGNLVQGLLYMWHASVYVMGVVPIVLALVSSMLILALLRGGRMLIVFVSALLASPFLFDIFALYQGNIVVYIPELPPYGILFNERYAMNWIGFVMVMPPLAASLVYARIAQRTILLPVGMLIASVILAIHINATAIHLSQSACTTCFTTIKTNWLATKPWRREIAPLLHERYEGGRILMTRAFFNEVSTKAGIPLNHFILEANEPYYAQALDAPWLYARWVVMFDADAANIPNWERTNEKVSATWGNTPEFDYFYELVHQAGSDQLYRLRTERVHEYVARAGVDPSQVPSLSSEGTWDPQTTHVQLSELLEGIPIPLDAFTRENLAHISHY
jgi:4-amino-4-deoxy-L-arabinose transferase-like glycosyltransferase